MAASLPSGRISLLDASNVSAWGALDDVVMGGVSESRLRSDASAGERPGEPAAVFEGNLSTRNNGGFASVRNRDFQPPADCCGESGVELRFLGDGQRYKVFIRTDPGWDAIGYSAGFETHAGQWQTVRLPWRAFSPVFRARSVVGAKPLDVGSVRSLQLMLSKFETDGALNPRFKGDGKFRLAVARICTYKD